MATASDMVWDWINEQQGDVMRGEAEEYFADAVHAIVPDDCQPDCGNGHVLDALSAALNALIDTDERKAELQKVLDRWRADDDDEEEEEGERYVYGDDEESECWP